MEGQTWSLTEKDKAAIFAKNLSKLGQYRTGGPFNLAIFGGALLCIGIGMTAVSTGNCDVCLFFIAVGAFTMIITISLMAVKSRKLEKQIVEFVQQQREPLNLREFGLEWGRDAVQSEFVRIIQKKNIRGRLDIVGGTF